MFHRSTDKCGKNPFMSWLMTAIVSKKCIEGALYKGTRSLTQFALITCFSSMS